MTKGTADQRDPNPSLHSGRAANCSDQEGPFATMFEMAGDPIVVLDDAANFLDLNSAACDLFGVPFEQLLGRNLADTAVPEYDFPSAWSTFLARGKDRGRRWLLRPDGERRLIESSATANFLPGRHLAIWRDVTDQWFLEMRLSQAEKNEALARLAAGIAHDFTNALSVIGGHAELLILESSGSVPVLRRAESILHATKQAAELATQLYAFSRQQVLSPGIVDLNEVLDQLSKALRSMVGDAIEVEIRKTPRLGKVHVDRTQISRAILTLAGSAAHAMPDGGRLVLETSALTLHETKITRGAELPAGEYVVLAISDNAPALSERARQHLFDPSSAESIRGAGLAIPAVYGIVQQSGGHLWVDSSPENGNIFKILLPSGSQTAVEAQAEELAKKDLHGNETILLAEDEPALREATREYLTCLGYRVLHASNGIEALEIARSTDRIDLLVTDLVMPKMSGKELVFHLSAERPSTKIIFISGYPYDVLTHAPALTLDVVLVHKPFSMRGLATKIREVLGEPAKAIAHVAR